MKKLMAMLGLGPKIDPAELAHIEEQARKQDRKEGAFPPDSVA